MRLSWRRLEADFLQDDAAVVVVAGVAHDRVHVGHMLKVTRAWNLLMGCCTVPSMAVVLDASCDGMDQHERVAEVAEMVFRCSAHAIHDRHETAAAGGVVGHGLKDLQREVGRPGEVLFRQCVEARVACR
jgi:hypothetical protein